MKASQRIFLIALALRLFPFLYVVIFHSEGLLIFDSHGYLDIADNLINHGTFSRSTETSSLFPDITRTPVFPLFLAAFKMLGSSVSIISFGLVLLGSLNAWLTYKISHHLFNKRIAFVAGILVAIDIPSILFSGFIMSETLFTTILLTALFYMLCKEKNLKNIAFSGLFLSILTLCRPIAVLLPLILLPIYFRQHQVLRKSILFFLTSYLLVFGWSLRNYQTFDTFALTSISSLNLYYFTAAPIKAKVHQISVKEAKQQLSQQLRSSRDWHGTVEEVSLMIDYCRSESFEIIKSHPLIFIKQSATGFIYFFTKPARSYVDIYFGLNEDTGGMISRKKLSSDTYHQFIQNTSGFAIVLVIFQILFLIVVLVGMVYVIIKNTGEKIIYLLITTILYFALASSITEVDARFRVPVLPIMAMIAAVGIERLRNRKKTKSLTCF